MPFVGLAHNKTMFVTSFLWPINIDCKHTVNRKWTRNNLCNSWHGSSVARRCNYFLMKMFTWYRAFLFCFVLFSCVSSQVASAEAFETAIKNTYTFCSRSIIMCRRKLCVHRSFYLITMCAEERKTTKKRNKHSHKHEWLEIVRKKKEQCVRNCRCGMQHQLTISPFDLSPYFHCALRASYIKYLNLNGSNDNLTIIETDPAHTKCNGSKRSNEQTKKKHNNRTHYQRHRYNIM